jgi:hypothetical protein
VAATTPSTRCRDCGRALAFADWTSGRPLCDACARPLGTIQRAPRVPARTPVGDARASDELLDAFPPALLDELVTALEAEAEKLDRAGPVAGVFAELEIGRTPRERHWAAWGFAAGFALNVGIAKWAQFASGAPTSEFIIPMVVGGVIAGATCAAISWGIARLRQPA